VTANAAALGVLRDGLPRVIGWVEFRMMRHVRTRISLGADAEAGFYIRHGYQTMLLLQWVYDPGRFDAEVEALATGPMKEMTWHRESSGGVPQLFIDLDEPNPDRGRERVGFRPGPVNRAGLLGEHGHRRRGARADDDGHDEPDHERGGRVDPHPRRTRNRHQAWAQSGDVLPPACP
jgi:hypothetical protein